MRANAVHAVLGPVINIRGVNVCLHSYLETTIHTNSPCIPIQETVDKGSCPEERNLQSAILLCVEQMTHQLA